MASQTKAALSAELGARAPAGLCWGVVLLSATLTAKACMQHGAATALFCALLAAVYALVMVRPEASLADIVLALAPCTCLGVAGASNLDLTSESYFRPFFAQAPGQKALLVLRALVVLLAILRLPDRAKGERGRALVLACVTSLIALSLIFAGMLLPTVVLAALIVRLRGDRPSPPTRSKGWLLPALSALSILVPHDDAIPPIAPLPPPRELMASWLARGNVFRAHRAAQAWSNSEQVPGAGHLALAVIDHDMGRVDKARKVLDRVFASAAPQEIMAEAHAFADLWRRESR